MNRKASTAPPGFVKWSLPPAILPIAVGGAFLSILSPNPALSAMAIAVLALGSALLWRPSESPILLFVFGFQWLQASAYLLQAGWQGLTVSQAAPYSGNVEAAIALSLCGIFVLAVGMRIGAGEWQEKYGRSARAVAQSRPVRAWFQLYVLAAIAAFFAQTFAWLAPGLTQPLLAVAVLKWAFYWMLAYASFVQSRSKIYLLGAFVFEFGLGFGAFFSDFKTVIFFTLFALVAANVRTSPRMVASIGALAALLLVLATVWTVIKPSYREFVNRGQASQIVTIGYGERLAKILELTSDLDAKSMSEGASLMIGRLSYVEIFGLVLDYVPRSVPYEDGALWLDAISRPFMPRLFFPDKGIIDDSERTNKYTGLSFAGADRGTSISIGYLGESYIDFGEIGMMVPVFFLGLLYGRIYRSMLEAPYSRGILGMAMASAILFVGCFLESSITKVFGGLIISVLAAWVVTRFIATRWIPWLQIKRTG